MQLKEARQAAGFTSVYGLAKTAGVERSGLLAIERGTRVPTIGTVQNLSNILQVNPADIEEFYFWRAAGEPCPCGCGGLMVLPNKTTARTLSVKLPCQGCGIQRVYSPSQRHTQFCQPCAPRPFRKAWRPKEQPANSEDTFRNLLAEAFDRKAMAMTDVAAAAGIHRATLGKWLRGQSTPKRRPQKLAAVLDAPELLEVFPSRYRIFVTCPECGRERWIKSIEIKNGVNSTTIDWEAGTGSYRCIACSASRRLTAFNQKRRKSYGQKYFIDHGKRLAASNTPEQRAKSVAAARAVNKTRTITEAERQNRSRGHISPSPIGRFDICRLCPGIVHARGQNNRVECHQQCLSTWRSESKNMHGYPPQTRGRPTPSEYLAGSHAMAVRHLLRGEDIGEFSVGKGDKRRRGTGLAAEYNMTRRGAIKRIKDYVERLPTDGRGGKQLQRWSEHLRAAAVEHGYLLQDDL